MEVSIIFGMMNNATTYLSLLLWLLFAHIIPHTILSHTHTVQFVMIHLKLKSLPKVKTLTTSAGMTFVDGSWLTIRFTIKMEIQNVNIEHPPWRDAQGLTMGNILYRLQQIEAI